MQGKGAPERVLGKGDAAATSNRQNSPETSWLKRGGAALGAWGPHGVAHLCCCVCLVCVRVCCMVGLLVWSPQDGCGSVPLAPRAARSHSPPLPLHPPLQPLGGQAAAPRRRSVSHVWIPDEEAVRCGRCKLKFSFSRRKHHCRVRGCVRCCAQGTLQGFLCVPPPRWGGGGGGGQCRARGWAQGAHRRCPWSLDAFSCWLPRPARLRVPLGGGMRRRGAIPLCCVLTAVAVSHSPLRTIPSGHPALPGHPAAAHPTLPNVCPAHAMLWAHAGLAGGWAGRGRLLVPPPDR